MVLGAKVGEGGSSEVFEWGDGQVIKLFRPEYAHALEREVTSARAVNRAGIASPRVHGVVDVDGRRGIVFDRVDGSTLLAQLLQGERTSGEVGRLLAEIHLAVHAVDVPSLPDLTDVVRASGFEFPRGRAVFHGDFHPGNVLMAGEAPLTIDWANAHLAPVAADVARTVMAVRYQALRAEQPGNELDRERAARRRILGAYLRTYAEATPEVAPQLPFWLTQSARALLRQEDDTADVADLQALAAGRAADVGDETLLPFLAD